MGCIVFINDLDKLVDGIQDVCAPLGKTARMGDIPRRTIRIGLATLGAEPHGGTIGEDFFGEPL